MSAENKLLGWHLVMSRAKNPEEYRASISERIREGLNRKGIGERVSARMKAQWNDPEYRRQRSEIVSANNRKRTISEETRAKISETKGGVRNRCLPLLLRGASVDDVLQLTSFKRNQIESLIDSSREKGILRRPTEEETRRAARKAHLGRPKGNKERNYSEEQKYAILLARHFCEEGHITKDLTYWDQLHEIYRRGRRELPESFVDQLRLEVFLAARTDIEKGDMTLIIAYGNLGNNVDTKWFGSSLVLDEEFVTFMVGNTTPPRYSADTNGVFFLDTPHGISRPVELDDGIMVFDTLVMANKRRERRSWKSPSGVEGSQET